MAIIDGTWEDEEDENPDQDVQQGNVVKTHSRRRRTGPADVKFAATLSALSANWWSVLDQEDRDTWLPGSGNEPRYYRGHIPDFKYNGWTLYAMQHFASLYYGTATPLQKRPASEIGYLYTPGGTASANTQRVTIELRADTSQPYNPHELFLYQVNPHRIDTDFGYYWTRLAWASDSIPAEAWTFNPLPPVWKYHRDVTVTTQWPFNVGEAVTFLARLRCGPAYLGSFLFSITATA